MDAVSQGSVDVAWAGAGWYSGKDTAFNMFSTVPFGPGIGEYLAWMYHGGGLQMAREMFAKYNLHNVPCLIIPPEASGWFRKEIKSVADLKGLKMRFFGLGAKVMEKLGVATQQLPSGEIFQALQLGTIDATEFSLPAIDQRLGFFQVAKFYYFPGWHQQATFFDPYFNKAKWDAYPDRYKAIVELACGDLVGTSFFPPVLLVVLVLGSIFGGWATPTEAAGVGALGAILLAWHAGKLDASTVRETIESSALTNAMVFMLFFGATSFSFVFRALGGDDIVRDVMKAAGLDTGWEILIFVQALVFVLGFFFDWIEISLIVLPVFAPLLKDLDFSARLGPGGNIVFLSWFIIVLAVNLQTSFLTPPFGFTLFCMRGTVPPSISMGDIYRGIVPFVILQLIGLALTIWLPELALWLPRATGLFY